MKKIWNQIYREMLSEFISIFILTAMQTGLIATLIISNKTDKPEANAFSAALGCGLTVMIAVYIGGGVSGAHINPAVTSTFAIMGKLPWIKVPFYFIAQYMGAFLGAAATHGCYKGAMMSYTGNFSDMAGIWTTFPAKFLSAENAMLDSIFSSAMLMLMILAISDPKNMNLPVGMAPFFYGLLVAACGMCFSFNCGNPMNPARDLGPRLWALISGHGPDVLAGSNDYVWWWIPVVFPHIGCLVGAIMYIVLIDWHHPDEEEIKEQKTHYVHYNGKTVPVDPIRRPSVLHEFSNEKGCSLNSSKPSPEVELLIGTENYEKSIDAKSNYYAETSEMTSL